MFDAMPDQPRRSAEPGAAQPPPGFTALLPAGALCVEATADMWSTGLWEEERILLAHATGQRVREFTAGRNCARTALQLAGLPPVAIGVGAHREPLFPAGVSGTITHTGSYCAAALLRIGAYAAIGIDAEANAPLSAGIRARISVPAERAMLERVGSGHGVCPGRLLFAVKEACYKAYFQVAGRFLGFQGLEVSLDLAQRSFTAQVLAADAPGPLRGHRLAGRCAWDTQLIRAAVALALPGQDAA